MKALKIAAILPWMLLAAGVLMAATQYGEAVIEKGEMTIVREGRSLQFDKVNTAIPVNEEDLIRVRDNSLVQLKSRESATISLGANAVFQVKPWRSQGKSGFLRALFGRFRAAVVGLSGGEQFNMKTATATIGVKGTGYLAQVTNRGSTLLVVIDHTVGFGGQRGGETDVTEGFTSLIININRPTPPANTPEGLGNGLNAPPANSDDGGNFNDEGILIKVGIVSQGDLDQGKGEGGGQGGGQGGGGSGTHNDRTDPNAAFDAIQRARVPLQFQPR